MKHAQRLRPMMLLTHPYRSSLILTVTKPSGRLSCEIRALYSYQELRHFVAALEATGDDRRRQIAVVGDLLEDMATHRSWGWTQNGLSRAREEAESALVRMTAQMPIRFTRILLGGDAGPHWASGFVSGCVTDTNAVKQTAVYQDAVRNYPEVTSWPALCTVHVGRGLPSALGTVGASAFDLKIMDRSGDRFLGERGVSRLSGPYQMIISTFENIHRVNGGEYRTLADNLSTSRNYTLQASPPPWASRPMSG